MDERVGLPSYPDNFFDLAIVDPPYGLSIDKHSQFSGGKRTGKKRNWKKGSWDNNIPSSDYFYHLFRVSKNQIIWGANYFTKHLPGTMGWIFWDKKQRLSQSDGELAFSSFNKALKVVPINRVYIKEYGCGFHPTQKPVKLYKWILSNYAKSGDLILDTHVGSASSLIAFESMGFNYHAFEIDTDYYQAARRRMSAGIQSAIF